MLVRLEYLSAQLAVKLQRVYIFSTMSCLYAKRACHTFFALNTWTSSMHHETRISIKCLVATGICIYGI